MKKLLFLFLGIASCAAASITLLWDKNTEPDISNYRLSRAVNGGGFVPTVVLTNSFTYQDIQPGNSYQFFVTAVNTNALESPPSPTISYSPAPLPPMINVQRVQVGGASGGTWVAVQVFFDTVNLATYQANGYTITATGTGGAVQQLAATNSPATFPFLTIQNYTFAAAIINATGQSPSGGTVFLSGKAPNTPTNVKVQTGP